MFPFQELNFPNNLYSIIMLVAFPSMVLTDSLAITSSNLLVIATLSAISKPIEPMSPTPITLWLVTSNPNVTVLPSLQRPGFTQLRTTMTTAHPLRQGDI